MINTYSDKVLYITGGGGLSEKAINIKTLSAIVASAIGINVIKHVSYESNKKCSSGAFLDELNIEVCRNIAQIESQYNKHNIAFIEATKEDTLKNLCPVLSIGKEIHHYIGLNSPENAMKYLFELKAKGEKRALITVPTDDNFDEITICSGTQIFELIDGKINNYIIYPENFGLKSENSIAMTGATPLYNKNLSIDILANKRQDAKLNALVFNVGVIIYLIGIAPTIQKGIIKAYESFDKGIPFQKLNEITRG